MLDEVVGRRLRGVERMAWYPADGSLPNFAVGSVHLWFEGGSGVHLDGKSDWTLEWSISAPGNDSWMSQYLYDFHGRWVLRDATWEEPFTGLAGRLLTSTTPLWNEMDEIVGMTLTFETRNVSIRLWEGEIDTSFVTPM